MRRPNKNMLVGLISKNNVLFTYLNDKVNLPTHIVEHTRRLLEITDNQHIYMDVDSFKAMGSKPLLNRFTRVFVNDGEKFNEKSSNLRFRLHHMSELDEIVSRKQQFEPETKIFFIGNSEFLKRCERYCNLLLITECAINIDSDEFDQVDILPESILDKFTRRREIYPEDVDKIKEYKRLKKNQLTGANTIISDNGMKIIDTSLSRIDESNPILQQPEYIFYEYRKRGA